MEWGCCEQPSANECTAQERTYGQQRRETAWYRYSLVRTQDSHHRKYKNNATADVVVFDLPSIARKESMPWCVVRVRPRSTHSGTLVLSNKYR